MKTKNYSFAYLVRAHALYLHHGCAVLELLLTTQSKGILSGHATTEVAVKGQGGAVGGLANALGDA